jgi:hypothetical protein
LEKTKEKSYVVLPYAIRLMENEEGKVEVDELNLGFFLNSCILYNYTTWIYQKIKSL